MIRAGVAGLLAAVMLFVGRAAPRAADPPVDDEQQIGQEVFNQLKTRVEIIGTSPLYDVLRPLAAPIVKTAQLRYKHPFSLYLVHEPRPNAFASPGGNVYVTDELLYFAKNIEELAGTLCHEFAHTIRHDTMTLIEEQRRLARRGIGAAILLGPSPAKVLAISLLGKLTSLSYSRDVEAEADLAGADLCAASGSNPWGLVWLFQDFEGPTPNECHSSSRIIRTTRVGLRRFARTFVRIRRPSVRSHPISRAPGRLPFRRTHPWCSSDEGDV